MGAPQNSYIHTLENLDFRLHAGQRKRKKKLKEWRVIRRLSCSGENVGERCLRSFISPWKLDDWMICTRQNYPQGFSKFSLFHERKSCSYAWQCPLNCLSDLICVILTFFCFVLYQQPSRSCWRPLLENMLQEMKYLWSVFW